MDKTIIDFGFINITWYAFLIVLSFIIAAVMVGNNKKVKECFKNKDVLYDYYFWLILFSIIGARVWYVLFSLDMYSNPLQIFAIWNGGLAIHGGILGGLLYTIYFANKNLIKTTILTDAIVPFLLLGQAIGRWGNFINQEAHGPATTYEFLKNTLHLPDFIVNQMNIGGVYYQPTFLYESIWNFTGFLIIILILNKLWKNKDGYITSFYLLWYGFIRFFIEQLRTDALTIFNIKVAELSSFLMFFAGILLFIYFYKENKKNKKIKKI